MGIIRVLDEKLASQIAAGEVVERPASVVKELIENALDAGSRRIDLMFQGGGIESLVIVDDGHGMSADDAALCFSRHATSKLAAIEDLRGIGTYGFRGEALAAIGSVAKVRLVTRPPDADMGFEVRVEGGRILHVGDVGASVGTRIEVKDLFYNVPARRKFLKTERTEAALVEDTVRMAALSRPDIAFRTVRDGKTKLDVTGADDGAPLSDPKRRERVIQCLGRNVRDALYALDVETDFLSLRGYVVAPLETRRDLKGIHLAVNGRPVQDRQLTQAVRAAYRTLLEVGRMPICSLDLGVDPSVVDVNVHPRKAEVRFEDPRRVSGHLIRLLGDFLLTTPWLNRAPARTYQLGSAPAAILGQPNSGGAVPIVDDSGVPTSPPASDASMRPSEGDPADAHRQRVRAALSKFHDRAMSKPYSIPRSSFSRRDSSERSAPPSLPFAGERNENASTSSGLSTSPGLGGAASFAAMRAVGQVGLTYLVLEGPGGMVVIDQHAAHERVVFERLRQRASEGAARCQPLLFPVQVALGPAEMSALEERGESLTNFGLDVSPFSDDSALIRGLPPELDGGKAERVVRDALAELSESGREDALDELRDAVCARLACHASVRAGQAMSPEEIRALLRDLDAIDLGAHCPHGRPVVRSVEFDEMAQWFDRHT